MVSPRSKVTAIRTLLVALLCLVGTVTGGYLLYRDFNQTAGQGQGPNMAKIERREAKVRRKPSKSFAWNNAQQDEKLFRRDSVQTGVGGAAAIRFNDGTLLELGENSLVVIDDIQNLSLDFLKGAVVLHTADGDRRVTVGVDGKAKFEELPIRLLKPEPLSRYFVQSGTNKPIRFAWKPRSGQENALPAGLTVQISPDRGFRGTRVRTFAVKDPKIFECETMLGEGSYFWRLAIGDKPLTDIGQFHVISASALQPLSPAGGEKLVTFGDETATPFRWLAAEDIGVASQVTHELQVAREPDFRDLVLRQEVTAASGSAALRGLPNSELYWRVQSRYADIQVLSRVEHFSQVKAQRPALAQTLPEDKKTLERLPSLHFSWTSDSQGLDYQLEIKDSQGKEIGGVKTRATSYLWKNPAPGVYRWRVAASHKGENVGETLWRSFSIFEGTRIGLRLPAKEQELYSWDKPAAFDFEWQKDELLSRQPGYAYQVVISKLPDFKAPLLGPRLREAVMPHDKLALDSGPYFWKVVLLDESGQTVKSSDTWHFFYGIYPPLKAPERVAPAAQSVITVVDQAQNTAASWQEVKGAETYEVTLYAIDPGRATASAGTLPPGARVVFQTTTEKPHADFKNLQPASYLWTVRAIDRIKRKGQAMTLSPFSVTYGELLGAPQITSPEVQ